MFDSDLYAARVRRKESQLRTKRLTCGCPVEAGADTYIRGCCDWVGCARHALDEHRCAVTVPAGPAPVPPLGRRMVPGTWERR